MPPGADRPPASADIAATRAFFGPKAAGWEDRFPDDEPRYAQAVAELAPPAGGAVLDAACGTGRALPVLRQAVGPGGTVIGIDVTAEMLAEARRLGRATAANLILADVSRLPLRDGSLDAVLAAGLLPHLADPIAGLRELARVCCRGARLALFHPIGRAALADRHGRELDPNDIRAEGPLRDALTRTGWRLKMIDDAADRYLALALR